MNTELRMKCPRCGKRAFDVSQLPQERIVFKGKCPQCKNLIEVPFTEEWVIHASNEKIITKAAI